MGYITSGKYLTNDLYPKTYNPDHTLAMFWQTNSVFPEKFAVGFQCSPTHSPENIR